MSKPTQAPPPGKRRSPKEMDMTSSTETPAQTIIDDEGWVAEIKIGYTW